MVNLANLSVARQRGREALKSNAWILRQIIRQAQAMQNDITQIANLFQEEKILSARKSRSLITSEEKFIHLLPQAIAASKNVLLFDLMLIHRFQAEVVREVQLDQTLIRDGPPSEIRHILASQDKQSISELKGLLSQIIDTTTGIRGGGVAGTAVMGMNMREGLTPNAVLLKGVINSAQNLQKDIHEIGSLEVTGSEKIAEVKLSEAIEINKKIAEFITLSVKIASSLMTYSLTLFYRLKREEQEEAEFHRKILSFEPSNNPKESAMIKSEMQRIIRQDALATKSMDDLMNTVGNIAHGLYEQLPV